MDICRAECLWRHVGLLLEHLAKIGTPRKAAPLRNLCDLHFGRGNEELLGAPNAGIAQIIGRRDLLLLTKQPKQKRRRDSCGVRDILYRNFRIIAALLDKILRLRNG